MANRTGSDRRDRTGLDRTETNLPTSGPIPVSTKSSAERLRGPTRRLVNPTLAIAAAAPRPSYRDILMAGGEVGRKGNRGAPSRSALSDRRRGRGRGHADDAIGRGREDHGRDRDRDRDRGHGLGGRGGLPPGVVVLRQPVPAQEPGVAVGVTFGRPREPINRLARAILRLSRTHTSILLPTPWERAVSAAATRPMQKTCKSIRGSVKTCL